MKKIIPFLLLVLATSAQADFGTRLCGIEAEPNEFVPSWGKVIIGEDQYTRYVIQYMYWHNVLRNQALWGSFYSTFEPDVIFYNYDGDAYGNEPIGYWDSDLPSPYVDTQFMDNSNEKAVTIGSAGAVHIDAEVMYYTVTRMTDGGGDASWVKLSSQRGIRDPVDCFTTWCSFGCEEYTNNVFAMPFNSSVEPTGRKFEAPGCVRYWYDWKYYPSPFFYECN